MIEWSYCCNFLFGMQINPFWRDLRDLLKEPSKEQVECQKPKAVLLSTGEMFVPYAWAVSAVGDFI